MGRLPKVKLFYFSAQSKRGCSDSALAQPTQAPAIADQRAPKPHNGPADVSPGPWGRGGSDLLGPLDFRAIATTIIQWIMNAGRWPSPQRYRKPGEPDLRPPPSPADVSAGPWGRRSDQSPVMPVRPYPPVPALRL